MGRAAYSVAAHFSAIIKHMPLRPVRSEQDYGAAVAAPNQLLDAGDADATLTALAGTRGCAIAFAIPRKM